MNKNDLLITNSSPRVSSFVRSPPKLWQDNVAACNQGNIQDSLQFLTEINRRMFYREYSEMKASRSFIMDLFLAWSLKTPPKTDLNMYSTRLLGLSLQAN